MLFVQSTLSELIPEELAGTPFEEFKKSPIYQKFAPDMPELQQAVSRIEPLNAQLYTLSNELNSLTFASKWQEARLFFRDNFPSTVKSLLVDLDQVVAVEDQILSTQKKAVQLLNTELNSQVSALQENLSQLEKQQHESQAISGQAVAQAENQVMVSGHNVETRIAGIEQVSLAIAAFVAFVGLLAAFLITRMMTRPVSQVVNMLGRLESGDLSALLPDFRIKSGTLSRGNRTIFSP